MVHFGLQKYAIYSYDAHPGTLDYVYGWSRRNLSRDQMVKNRISLLVLALVFYLTTVYQGYFPMRIGKIKIFLLEKTYNGP